MSISPLRAQDYNPDILNTLANLSSDEVFTPPEVANQVLDLLPQELFLSPDTTFLDPATKSGVFLREIARRLMVGLADVIPDEQERRDHIFHKQLYGIAITELTSLMSRRSLYCSKFPNGRYSVSRIDSAEGNIRFKRLEHRFVDGKCVYCGARENQFGKQVREGLEYHAYEFIHTTKPEEILKMKFDVIVGNPPYQLSDGGHGVSAQPIYHIFVEQAIKLNPKYLSLIIPSRWFAGGKGLQNFRKMMLNDTRIREIVDYENANDVFPGVDIAGGVCYYLWDRDNPGLCRITNIKANEKHVSVRALNEFDVLIRDGRSINIIHKVAEKNEMTMDSQVTARKPFGLATNIRPEAKGELTLRWQNGEGPFPDKKIIVGREMIDSYKVITSYVGYDHAGNPDKEGKRRVFSRIDILKPKVICTETYLVVGYYDKLEKCENLVSYMKTRLFRFLVSQFMFSHHITRSAYRLVPIQDFSKPWTDAELYAKYGLNQEEIDFIESRIQPMDTEGDNDDA